MRPQAAVSRPSSLTGPGSAGRERTLPVSALVGMTDCNSAPHPSRNEEIDMSTMTAPKPAKLILSKQQQHLIKWANGTQAGKGSATSQVISKVTSFVNLIGTPPDDDYGLARAVLNKSEVKHTVTLTAGIISLADFLWELYQTDTD